MGSIIIIATIQCIQIPHMIWNADMMLETGAISRVHPVIDWLLYGVELIEIISIINVGMIMFSLIKKRKEQNHMQHKAGLTQIQIEKETGQDMSLFCEKCNSRRLPKWIKEENRTHWLCETCSNYVDEKNNFICQSTK